MTVTITKKDIIFCSVIAALIIVLCASALVYSAGGRESNESKTASEQQNAAPSSFNIDLPKLHANLPPGSHPHPSCYMKLKYLSTRTAVFNDNNPYNTAFMGGVGDSGPYISTLQDINGDNLPDYLFAVNWTQVGGFDVTSEHVTCIYLNNGNGWTKAYECYARTQINTQTGNLTPGIYAGDCAGPPISKN